jgi:hypothetical protein
VVQLNLWFYEPFNDELIVHPHGITVMCVGPAINATSHSLVNGDIQLTSHTIRKPLGWCRLNWIPTNASRVLKSEDNTAGSSQITFTISPAKLLEVNKRVWLVTQFFTIKSGFYICYYF